MLVALEGIAGAGKTTLLKELSSRLKKVHFVDEFCDDYINGYIDYLIKRDPYLRLPSPSETPLSQAIILMGGLIYKYETKIKPYLRGRNIVIVDRYKDSIYAYQLETAYMQGIRDRGSIHQWLCARFRRSILNAVYTLCGT
jgi:thymidylate kinase